LATPVEANPSAATPVSSEERLGRTGGFLKNFFSLSLEVLPAFATDKPIEVWFQDEARVGQKGSIEYVWAPIGSRPPMVRDNRHDSVHIFGAICPARGVVRRSSCRASTPRR